MKKVILLGSSRPNGDTAQLSNALVSNSEWDLINLSDYNFSYFDYNHENRDDDYLGLLTQIIDNYDTIIFATPVYWYAMSGIMKVFFDRLSDVLSIEKDLGRRLRGKHMAAVSCSTGNNLGDAFWLPFIESATYLGMHYLGHMHTITGEDYSSKILEFVDRIDNKTK